MGQALRRVAGKAESAVFEPPPPRPRVEKDPRPRAGVQDHLASNGPDGFSRSKNEPGILEERDPQFEAMLSKMVGRITSRPGGKLEMGEAAIVKQYSHPLPKVRTSRVEGTPDTSKSTPPGTVDIKQLKQIFLLYEGRSEEQKGRMAVAEIAKKFRLEAAQVQRILQFASLPPEDTNKDTQNKET